MSPTATEGVPCTEPVFHWCLFAALRLLPASVLGHSERGGSNPTGRERDKLWEQRHNSRRKQWPGLIAVFPYLISLYSYTIQHGSSAMSTFLKNTEAMKAAYVAEGRTATNNGWS